MQRKLPVSRTLISSPATSRGGFLLRARLRIPAKQDVDGATLHPGMAEGLISALRFNPGAFQGRLVHRPDRKIRAYVQSVRQGALRIGWLSIAEQTKRGTAAAVATICPMARTGFQWNLVSDGAGGMPGLPVLTIGSRAFPRRMVA